MAALSAFGQQGMAPLPDEVPEISVRPVFFEDKVNLKNEADIMAFVQSKWPWLKENGHSLILKSKKESILGTHYQFQQYYFDKPVFYGGFKVSVDKKNDLIQAASYMGFVDADAFTNAEIEAADGILMVKSRPFAVKRQYETGSGLEQWETFTNARGDVIWQHDIKEYFSKDTTIKAKVFLTNPIQSARTIYGAPFINGNDTDVPAIVDQQKTVTLKGSFENDTFRLQYGTLRFGEVSGPKTIPAWSVSDAFLNNRSHDFFEDQNAFYHLQSQINYVQGLGFANLVDTFIIDAHAYNGGDNSSFNPYRYPYEFEFGTGGVEDAEDGQVVVHELGHAFCEKAATGTSIGRERESMEEGTCDYFSVSYSRTFNDHQWYKVFSWDGHNEFWDGFMATTKKVYPKDMTNNENNDREIWSSPLMCIYEKIGKSKTDSLVLAHLYLQVPNATMPQMARVLLKVDTVLWGGRHMAQIWECFVERGILGFGADVPVQPDLNAQIIISNSWDWAVGEGALRIEHRNQQPFEACILTIDGKLKVKYEQGKESLSIQPKDFPTGTYTLQIKMLNGQTVHRNLIRF